jgi:HD-GYP domain-containing protein (c-di-GMP phosphodiesterase class II)
MSDAQNILGKITALRQRLEQGRGEEGEPAGLAALAREVAAAAEHEAQLDAAVRPLTLAPGEDGPPLPPQMTSRARRVLELGRDLLVRLRGLADAFTPADPETQPLLGRDEPLARHYRETVAMTDTALRLVPLFPGAAAAQLRLSEGLEAILATVAVRLRALTAGVTRAREEEGRIGRLTDLLRALDAGQPMDAAPFLVIAEEIVTDAADGLPLRFVPADARDPGRFAAGHGLTVARILARVARHDQDLRGRLLEVVLAGLVHDAGMVRVPAEVLGHPGPLTDDERRAVESHCHAGASLVGRLLPDAAWLAEAARGHHERLDGTGYPDGLHAHHLPLLTRLLAVCDVYAALCVARPHRAALDTRTALTDTLLLAEQGQLDRHHAERLLHLSFYPSGSAVELADGSVGVVVATAAPGRDLRNPARPVVALLLDPEGQPLPAPRHLDLLQCEGISIVRTLGAAERRAGLGAFFPEWVSG